MKICGYTALEGYFARTTGVGKHIEQMFRGLAASPGVELTVLAARGQVGEGTGIPASHPLAGLNSTILPYRRRTIEWRWRLTGSPSVDRWADGADWIYAPYETTVPSKKARRAVTFHSLFWFDRSLPLYYSWAYRAKRLRLGWEFRKLAHSADLILTVSEFVRRQLIDWLGVDEHRIVVVGNGVEEEFFAAGIEPRKPPADGRPYVVCLSGLNYLDGAEYVLATAEALWRKDRSVRILVAGHQNEPKYVAQARAHSNIHLLGYVAKQQLAPLMRDSIALLFLNRYESFGIGAAEAMAAGTPVIGTDFTAVPEVVSGAGLVVDVSDPVAIAEHIVGLSRNENLRAQYITRGHERAKQFTWAACVEQLRIALHRN